ncbi:hypothetical protein Tco_0550289 [Tanacetum coccineum]
MDITRAQQKALDDDLVAPANRLKIGKCNLRLSSNLNSKEPTLQVVLDALKLTSFYKAFEITADVPEIYMQEFWVTASRHHSSLCFKMNGKSHTFNVDNFRDMLQICPKLPSQKFEDPLFEEEILSFIRDLGHTGEIKIYGVILPQHLTNQAMLESEAYKTYHAYAIGEKIRKPKYVKNKADPESSPKKKSAQAFEGKRLKTSAKVALYEAEQMKLATKRSKTQFHSSHASGSGADEGTGVTLGVPDVPTYDSEDEQISWKSSDEDDDDDQNDDNADTEDDDDQNDDNADTEDDDDQNNDNADNEGNDDQDDDNEQTELNNDDADFAHPKLSTFDEKERQDEKDKEEEWSDDEAYDEETQGVNDEGEELDEEDTNKEDEVNELYKDVNINLEDATPEVQQQSSFISSRFISNMLNPNSDTGIDSILNLNTESTSLVDVPVSTNVEMPPSSVTTLPLPPIPLFQPQHQTPVPLPAIVPSTSLQNLTIFGSLFKFEDRVKGLEDDFLEFKQANQFAEAVSSIPDIVFTLRDEAQAENEDFINTLDENIRKIIKRQVKEQVKEQVSKILPKIEKLVNDQLEAEVLTRSSNQAKTSHVVAANLSKLELKKIIIDKMENNKSIDRSIQQKTIYKALVDAYETEKDILETYGDTGTFKRRRDDEDEDEEPSAGSN